MAIEHTIVNRIRSMQDKLNKLTEQRNADFAKASNPKKRVMIAQDVIKRIKSEQYVPQAGNWLYINTENGHHVTGSDSLQNAIVSKAVECTCCALGGLVASCVVFNNHAKVADISTIANGFTLMEGTDTGVGLLGIFSQAQLTLIECVFERGDGGSRFRELPDYIRERARRFASRTTEDQDRERLLAIMENIVRNKGTFKP